MSKEPNNIDRLVREKLDGFEMAPPPGVWENTATSLNGGRKKRFFLWFVLSFVFLTALGTSIYFLAFQHDETEQLAINNSIGQKEQLNQENSNEENGLNSEDKTSSTYSNNQSDDKNGSSSNSTTDNGTNGSFEDSNGKNQIDSERSSSSFNGDGSNNNDGSRKHGSDKTDSNGKRTANGDNKRTNSSGKTGNDKTTKGDGGAPNPLFNNSSKKGGDNLAGSRTLNGDTEKKGSRNLSDEKTDSQSSSGDDKQNDVSNSSESGNGENNGFLPIRPVKEFATEEPSIANDKVEVRPLVVSAPFWKAFSLEGAIGMSTFRNNPKNTTPENLLNALNAAASGERSFDFRFGLNYHFTNRFSLQSGIHYNASRENYTYGNEQIQTFTTFDTLSFSVDSITLDTTFMIDTNIFDSTIMSASNVLNSYRILTLPFQFAWSQPISKRGTLEFALGGAISIFGRNSGSIIDSDTNTVIGAEVGYKTTGLLSLGGSIKYLHRFGNHHAVYVEPWAQFGISNQSTPSLNYESLRRRYGIRVGYRFYF